MYGGQGEKRNRLNHQPRKNSDGANRVDFRGDKKGSEGGGAEGLENVQKGVKQKISPWTTKGSQPKFPVVKAGKKNFKGTRKTGRKKNGICRSPTEGRVKFKKRAATDRGTHRISQKTCAGRACPKGVPG